MNFYLDTDRYFKLTLNEKKSLFAWGYEILINFNKFTKNLQTMKLYTKLKKIVNIHIENNEVEEVMYAEFFTMISQFTIYQTKENFENFNKEITYPCGEFYKDFTQNKDLLQIKPYNNQKKKIAFIFERLVEHSPFKVVFSLLKQLQKDKQFTDNYEIEVYSLNYFLPLYNLKEIEKSLKDINITIIYPINTYLELDNYNNRFQRAIQIRQTLIENQVDILIACFNSYDLLNFLFSTRTAPEQIFWSHNGGHYNVPQIDKRISHYTQQSSEYKLKYFHCL